MPDMTTCFAFVALTGSLLMGCGDGTGSNGEDPCVGMPCNDQNQCTTDSCVNGVCKNDPVAYGTPCTSGMCSAGECCATSPSETFDNGDFADGDWSSTEVEGVSQGMRTLDSVTTVPNGGNPDAYHLVQATLIATAEPEQPASIWVAHALQGATYNPSVDGKICSLRFSLDGSDQFDMPQRATFYSVFILQNNTYYWSDRFSSANDRWETHVWTSNEFIRIDGDGPAQPVLDASASGTEIQFGYMTGSSRPTSTPDVPGTTFTAADNFSVEIFPPAP